MTKPQAKKPSNPALWKKAKTKARATAEGSPKGRWSVRKSALAQLFYETQGGKWEKSEAPKK